jgi:hypothetical protein
LPDCGRTLMESNDRCNHRKCCQQGQDREGAPPPPGAAPGGVMSSGQEYGSGGWQRG